MSNTPKQLEQDNYTELLNSIVNSEVDKDEKIKMLNVIKQNLQLNRQVKNTNMYQQEQNYLSALKNPFMVQPQLAFQQQQGQQSNPNSMMNFPMPNPMMFANTGMGGLGNYQQLYMYEVINYKLNQLLMGVDKINETMTSVSENTIDELIEQVNNTPTNTTATENTNTATNTILDKVNNVLGLNDDEDEEEEANNEEEIPLYTENNLINNITGNNNNTASNNNTANNTATNNNTTANNNTARNNNTVANNNTANNTARNNNTANNTARNNNTASNNNTARNNNTAANNTASNNNNTASDEDDDVPDIKPEDEEQTGGFWGKLVNNLL